MGERSSAMRTLFRAASDRGSVTPEMGSGQLALARRRVLVAAVILGGTMAAYGVAYRTVWAEDATAIGQLVAPTTVLFFTAIGLLVWRAVATRTQLVVAAVTLQLTLGAALALMEPFDLEPTERPFSLISWNCANVLLVPLLVPASTPVVLAVALAIASLTPLGFWLLGGVAGAPVHPPDVLASLGIPPLVCAALALLPSNVLTQLRRDLSQARRLGAYELVERLGAGGMGEVWRGTHRFLARPAAIKLIRPELLGGTPETRARAVARFEREAQTIATLESPHTVELYDFGVAEDGALYLVMELLRGIDLQHLVDAHGPLPTERAVHLLLQACESLAEAHALGLVHRDIKPANLYVGPRGAAEDVLRVLDFGLVTASSPDGADVDQTHEGKIRGTPTTLAPEAATGEAPVDGRADVYALGCVAFFLVTGETVFDARTPMDMVIAHVTRAPEPPSTRAPGPVPASFDALVLACLAKDPAARIASAEAVAQGLREVAAELEPWTPERARGWWHANEPASARRPAPSRIPDQPRSEALDS